MYVPIVRAILKDISKYGIGNGDLLLQMKTLSIATSVFGDVIDVFESRIVCLGPYTMRRFVGDLVDLIERHIEQLSLHRKSACM